ncbi:RFC4 [Hepatospora eriocheir]|uniref:RFC4 n=1 Tax=Hepatospora eriocheir TaxID=1081669 RepID=A0A1X0QDM9_9MICR|nr:RFC4 [Hepatospora eriocheir]
MLLVDLYKPRILEDVLGNKQVIKIIEEMGVDFPHLCLTGPPGTGKTTVAHILKSQFKSLELNASDERGIDVVRNKIKNFCNRIDNKQLLIILDECDNLTLIAQQALRRLMEGDTKFILICNDVSKVIEPIQSRCAILKFERISISEFLPRIKEICKKENLNLTPSALKTVINLSKGDFRNCLNILQPLINLKCEITDTFLYKLNGVPSYDKIETLYHLIKDVNLKEINLLLNELTDNYDNSDIISGLYQICKINNDFNILKVCSKYQFKLVNGINSKIQLFSMIYLIIKDN